MVGRVCTVVVTIYEQLSLVAKDHCSDLMLVEIVCEICDQM